jgi:hypothetical protein
MAKDSRPQFDKIECPNCGKLIPISDALQHQLTERVKEEMQKQILEREKEVTARARELDKKEMELSKTEKSIEKQVEGRLKLEREKLEKKAREKAEEEISLELRDVKIQLKEKEQKLEEAQKAELALRKREQELEENKRTLELEMTRKMDAERKKIQEEVSKSIMEERRLKDAEKDKLINDLKWQLEEARRKAEQGSQQLQGEVQELDLEEFLKENFPFDDIQPVQKGVRGADVLQRVLTRTGNFCGAILWESKRTKNWSEGWIAKLKGDQREAKADLAVLMSDMLPKEIAGFGQRNGIWVTNQLSILGLAVALRLMLTQVALTKLAAESKDEKVEVLFRYLTGPEFRQRVEAVVETFITMKQDLDKEKRAATSRWSKQEKHIERAITAIAGMHGDLRGLIGSSMQPIPALESGEEEEITTEGRVDESEEKSDDEEVKPEDIPF